MVSCFAPLLRWIVTCWAPGEQRLALALDASTLSDRFTVLCISVVYRGCALPVAWCIVPAGSLETRLARAAGLSGWGRSPVVDGDCPC